MIILLLTICLFSINTSVGSGAAGDDSDLIQELPGVNFELDFKHYSGYLQVSGTHFLHYWFVTSKGDPSKDPLIFWFNGGPGCSSMEGLLHEMGPYQINDDGKTLRQNPNSWNAIASVVYIEAPAGVGYSYAADGNTTTNDDLTSAENYEAIKQFFGKFPNFRENPAYIMGESYGGIYIPTLTVRVIRGMKDFRINLKGIAIGNGYVNTNMNIDTTVRFAYGHGLIDEKVWKTLELQCCGGCIDGCDLSTLTDACGKMVSNVYDFVWNGGLNTYDLYQECDVSPSINSFRFTALKVGLISLKHSRKNPPKHLARWNLLRGTKQKPNFGEGIPCLNDTSIIDYMNSPKVRSALNIPNHLGRWDICSADISEKYGRIYDDMTPFVMEILNSNFEVLLYYGDTDMACNFMMGEAFSSNLGLKKICPKTPIKYRKQIIGFKTLYEKELTFLTVRGAGHMVPEWRAPQMYFILSQFLSNCLRNECHVH